MNVTPYHTKLFAHELTRRCASDDVGKLAGALVDAQVDLNPHQIEEAKVLESQPEAALFVRRAGRNRPAARAAH